MAMLNCAHVNLFGDDRLSKELWHSALQAALEYLSKRGLPRASISVDFDAPEIDTVNLELLSIGAGRCLSTSSRQLPALISNNSLSFSDMNVRHSRK
jgi:hypothetical protein